MWSGVGVPVSLLAGGACDEEPWRGSCIDNHRLRSAATVGGIVGVWNACRRYAYNVMLLCYLSVGGSGWCDTRTSGTRLLGGLFNPPTVAYAPQSGVKDILAPLGQFTTLVCVGLRMYKLFWGNLPRSSGWDCECIATAG